MILKLFVLSLLSYIYRLGCPTVVDALILIYFDIACKMLYSLAVEVFTI